MVYRSKPSKSLRSDKEDFLTALPSEFLNAFTPMPIRHPYFEQKVRFIFDQAIHNAGEARAAMVSLSKGAK